MSRHAGGGQRATTSASLPIADSAGAVARAHGITARLHASAARIEAGRALPSDIIAALHEARLFRLLLPRSLGGDELDLKTLAEAIEVIAASDQGLGRARVRTSGLTTLMGLPAA